jgi:molybdopterin-guanine dinucleotide biosynthesis protein A
MKELVRRGYGEELATYATSCDVPLLQVQFVREVLASLGDYQAAVPVEERFEHSLAAAYRLGVLPEIERLLTADQLRPAFLFDRVATCRIPVDSLRKADPQLLSLQNCNRPEDYLAALRWAGIPAHDLA